MSVKILNLTNVTPTPCVPTLKDRTSVAVLVASKEMAGFAQVSLYCYLGSLVLKIILMVVLFSITIKTKFLIMLLS